jgi:hypothetical protein
MKRIWVAVLIAALLAPATALADTPALTPLDAQNPSWPDDLTWNDYKPLPGRDYSDPTIQPSVKKWRVALVMTDFPDREYSVTQPVGSTIYGNPTAEAHDIPRADVPAFYRDFLNKPQPLNHFQTMNRSFDNIFYVAAGQDQSSTWQEFGEMRWTDRELVPEGFGPHVYDPTLPNWGDTRYVPATLALTLGTPATFGTILPGFGHEYAASTSANVISTAGDATLSVSDPSTTATGHLVNGAFSLHEPLRVADQPLPTTVKTYSGPVSNDPISIGFKQLVSATEPLRTGADSKTLAFTLSTTTP